MDEVASLTEALEVPHPVISWIMIQMGCGKNDPRLAQVDSPHKIRPASRSAMIGAPRLEVAVEPAAIRQALYDLAVRSTASFAKTAAYKRRLLSSATGPRLCDGV